AGRVEGAKTTRLKVSLLPAAMLALAVSVTVPPDCTNVKASLPAGCVIEAEVEPAGKGAGRHTPAAALGALVGGVVGWGAFVPAVTEEGPLAVTARSAELALVLSAKLAMAVPQLLLEADVANSFVAQNVPLTGSTLMPLKSPARLPLVKSS